jgi:hypothetical protein
MIEYRIHGRIETAQPGTYVARVWVSRADDPHDREVSIAHTCYPCSWDDARRECERFVADVTRQLLREGHRVAEVRIV